MEITDFIVSRRNAALLVGDYGTYRRQCTRRLLILQKRLGRSTAKGRKYTAKPSITADEISHSNDYVRLLLLLSERAWAYAMHMKTLHAADSTSTAISGSTRTHIISRLRKAERYAQDLTEVLVPQEHGVGDGESRLGALAYLSMIRGTRNFESQKWESCVRSYSEVYLIYSALARSPQSHQGESYRELLSNIVEPSLRYAAYQLKLPRTTSIAAIVSKYSHKGSTTYQEVAKIEPGLLDKEAKDDRAESTTTAVDGTAYELPKTISWRSRTVTLEDANIAQALAAAKAAEEKLRLFSAGADAGEAEQIAAYEQVLGPSQDAVDATKTAIDELTADGVSQGDQRMQALQVTRTAVNYALIGWRIGRNRILCGKDDGAVFEQDPSHILEMANQQGGPVSVKSEGNGKKLARLRERVALYDTTIQSLDSVSELPGVAADQPLVEEVQSRRSYFSALRLLSVGRSHSLLENNKDALALLSKALKQSLAVKSTTSMSPSSDHVLNMEVSNEQAAGLQTLLHGLVSRNRALVELEQLSAEAARTDKAGHPGSVALIERLDEYPSNGADLTNLVMYPPRLRPVPVKPLFFDVAWNYINYPGRSSIAVESGSLTGTHDSEEKRQARKGWFGFGR